MTLSDPTVPLSTPTAMSLNRKLCHRCLSMRVQHFAAVVVASLLNQDRAKQKGDFLEPTIALTCEAEIETRLTASIPKRFCSIYELASSQPACYHPLAVMVSRLHDVSEFRCTVSPFVLDKKGG
jgi:hypothetical protein